MEFLLHREEEIRSNSPDLLKEQGGGLFLSAIKTCYKNLLRYIIRQGIKL